MKHLIRFLLSPRTAPCSRPILFLPLLLLTACLSAPAIGAPPTLKIGLVAPFEGLHRPLGYEALFAVKLALQEQNRQGGINGYRLELVALNDFDDPAEAAMQARALIADPDVIGVVGHLSSAATMAGLPVYRQAGLAVSIPWPVYPAALNGPGVVSVTATRDDIKGRLQSVIQEAGYSKILVVNPAQQISDAVSPSQALYLAGDGVNAGETLLTLSRRGLNPPRFGDVDAGSPQLVQVAGDAANGLIFASPGPAPADIDAAAFQQAYQALAGFPPGPRAVLAYDATRVLLNALAQAMSSTSARPTRKHVGQAITAIRHHGLTGTIVFDLQGQRAHAPIWVYQIDNKQYPGKLILYDGEE